jgi:hypothetical protein
MTTDPDSGRAAATPRFTIALHDAVAIAGSAVAARLGRRLEAAGCTILRAEPPGDAGEPEFSARYGAIENFRQLRQLAAGAHGLHRPATRVWRRPDGRFVDPLRPELVAEGFASAGDVLTARQNHLLAVRRVLEECGVFLFSLGQTAAWLASDGTALPAAPATLGIDPPGDAATLHHFSTADMRADLAAFLADLAAVNPGARVILTLSDNELADEITASQEKIACFVHGTEEDAEQFLREFVGSTSA